MKRIKAYLIIPQILFGLLLQRLFGFVPRIGLAYDELSARIDFDTSFAPRTMQKPILKLSINDITNTNLRKTLKLSPFKWNVYLVGEEVKNRQPIFITRDEIQTGAKFYSQRISDHEIDRRYLNKRYLKQQKKSISELEPQFYIVAAIHTDEHVKMKLERSNRYEKKKKKSLEKLVNECIKFDKLTGRSKSVYGDYTYYPIIFKVVKANRIDLVQKIIKSCIDSDEVIEVLSQKIDTEGWQDKNGKSLLDFANTDEMKTLLKQYIS